MDPYRIVVASHDFKFVAGLRAHLAALPSVEVRDDRWSGPRPGDNDEAVSRSLVEWADVVLCEWCQANAVWYSRNKRPHQRLIVRFHRFEIENDMPNLVDIAAVDQMVFVAEHMRLAARDKFGWTDETRQQVVWNAVDTTAFDLPKLPSALTTFGLLGWVPRLKRIDRALDVLEAARAGDDRFRLLVKGKPPWEHPWIWRRERERWFVADVLARIERSAHLRDAVLFEPHGDVRDWLRGVGNILSVSDEEGNPVSIAEGAASGAVPVVLRRPGSSDYPAEWVHDDPDSAAASVRAKAWPDRSARAKRFAAERFSTDRIFPVWERIIGFSQRTLERSEVSG
jgi:glycosyltransferase involved in cell wall biosynthesis